MLGFDAFGREFLSLVRAAVKLPQVLNQQAGGMRAVPFTGRQLVSSIDTPVVLVHGYLGTDTPWTPLARRLHTEGFTNVFTLRYDSLSAGVPELAAGLAQDVIQAMTQVQRPDVHLVGHSLGGLLARYAVQLLGLDRVTRSVITVATPHHGSPLALLGPGPAAAQLRPGSMLLRRLPPLQATPQVSWAVIHAGIDLVVPPPEADDALCLAGYGHHSILSSPELADAVVAHLLGAEQPRAGEATEGPAAPTRAAS